MGNIILIGPICAGESTVAELLSKKTGMPRCSLDDIRYKYYEELNYDHNHALQLQEKYGFWEKYKYWKPFEAHLVVRVLEEYKDHIIDFGAGHSVYEEEAGSFISESRSSDAERTFCFSINPFER